MEAPICELKGLQTMRVVQIEGQMDQNWKEASA
jgi:hypothetical protein